MVCQHLDKSNEKTRTCALVIIQDLRLELNIKPVTSTLDANNLSTHVYVDDLAFTSHPKNKRAMNCCG